MRLKFLIYTLAFTLCLGCNEDSNTTTVESNAIQQSTPKISKKDIERLNYNDYLLSSDASKATLDWLKYQELNTQMENLKRADLSYFQSDVTLITAFLNDFKAEIPPKFATNEINARIVVLETNILKLNSFLSLDNISKEDKLEGIKDLLIAFSNLNLQINKKLEFEANDIFKPN